jgi:hypothetical protein
VKKRLTPFEAWYDSDPVHRSNQSYEPSEQARLAWAGACLACAAELDKCRDDRAAELCRRMAEL